MTNQQGSTARTLTEEEVAAVEKEYHQLAVKLETQTIEQREFLKREVLKDKNISDAKRNHLTQLLDEGGFKMSVFRITDANVLQKPHVQVTYDIHDDVYAYLRQPESTLPKRLIGFLEGGAVLDTNKATAEDLMPQTGKTKAY